MLLIGHEHIMKFAESHLTALLVIGGLLLLGVALFSNKAMKAHFVAYTLFP